jgi:hypothetical protein
LQMLTTLASVQISYLVGCLLAAHLPARAELPLRPHANALRCIQATHFRKDTKLQFWSLCDHFRSERSGSRTLDPSITPRSDGAMNPRRVAITATALFGTAFTGRFAAVRGRNSTRAARGGERL